MPDRPVVLRQWSQPTLGANTKELRSLATRLTYLSAVASSRRPCCPPSPAPCAHGDEAAGFNVAFVPDGTQAPRYVSFPFRPIVPADRQRSNPAPYRGSVPRRCFNNLVPARFSRTHLSVCLFVCRRSILVHARSRVSRNSTRF